MPNNPINITGIDPLNTNNLILSDGGNSGVDPGDTVTWNIQSGSGVAAIVAIVDKFASTPTAPDLFAPDDPAPWPQSDSSTWRGTVNANMTSGQSESYYITWTPSDGTPDRVFDPIIRVK